MAAKRCSSCNLVNPSSAMTCDCGYSFVDGSKGRALDVQSQRVADYSDPTSRAARGVLRRIVVMIAFGLIIALVRMLTR